MCSFSKQRLTVGGATCSKTWLRQHAIRYLQARAEFFAKFLCKRVERLGCWAPAAKQSLDSERRRGGDSCGISDGGKSSATCIEEQVRYDSHARTTRHLCRDGSGLRTSSRRTHNVLQKLSMNNKNALVVVTIAYLKRAQVRYSRTGLWRRLPWYVPVPARLLLLLFLQHGH